LRVRHLLLIDEGSGLLRPSGIVNDPRLLGSNQEDCVCAIKSAKWCLCSK
jgi:hypothetical protein